MSDHNFMRMFRFQAQVMLSTDPRDITWALQFNKNSTKFLFKALKWVDNMTWARLHDGWKKLREVE